MNKLFRPIALSLLGCGLICVPTDRVSGQDAFDFDRLDQELAAEQPAGDTAPRDSAPADNAVAPADPAAAAPLEESAVVEAIRQTEPQTPSDLMRAIDQLIRVERADVAAAYLDRLVKLSLDDAALAQLYRKFGTATMIRLARTSELAPQSNEFALSVMQAGRRLLQDPGQLAKWVAQLSAEDRATQYGAAEQLLRAGPSSVPPLIEGLAAGDASQKVLRAWGLAILQRLGKDALEPLYGYLGSSEAAERRVTAIAALGRLGAGESLPYLVAPLFAPREGQQEQRAAAEAWQQILKRLPDREAALQLLEREADAAYRGQPGTAPDPDDQVVRWAWDAESRRLQPRPMRSAEAAALKAARLYEDLARLRPDDNAAAQRYLISRLEVDQSVSGLDQPLPRGAGTAFNLVQQSDGAWVNALLQQAVDDQHEAAAMGAAEVLGTLRDASTLQSSGPAGAANAAPLVHALSHANRRVRFAAAQAIAEIKPAGSFAGAGRLADVLEYFATSRGQRAAVIAHPNQNMAQNLAGLLASRGFRPLTVVTARELQKAATSTADVEVLLVSDALNDASLWSTLEALRVHPRTARLPIGILARPDTRDAAERTAEAHRRTLVLGEQADNATLDVQLPQLLALADRDAIAPERRMQQAEAALRMLDRLVSGDPPAELDLELRVPGFADALSAPELITDTTHLLSKIACRAAQQSLLEFASQHARPLSAREAAATAFRQSATQFGILLSQTQVVRQYERYNQSRDLDRETQVLLGAILDTIEDSAQSEPVTR